MVFYSVNNLRVDHNLDLCAIILTLGYYAKFSTGGWINAL